MAFDIALSEDRKNAMTAAGLWPNRLLTDYFDAVARRHPERIAIVSASGETGGATRLSYAELARNVDSIALGLAGLGVRRGDVISFQLPSWWQFCATYLACVRIGAVANPLIPIFRQRELRFMLNFAESRVVIAPKRFRDFDYGDMLVALKPDIPTLRHVLLTGGEGETSFENVLLQRAPNADIDPQQLFRERRMDPHELTELMYTSGTSGQPKGVMHISNALLGAALSFIDCVKLTPDDVVFMPSPLGHQTGFVYGMMISIILGTKLVLLDAWNPSLAGRLIRSEGATYTFASTPFLADLVDAPDLDREILGSLRLFVCAGAPIPSVLVQRATERYGFSVLSGWGMTEVGCATIARPGDPAEKIVGTDGKAIAGMEVRIVDAEHKVRPAGEIGFLQARGPAMFVGYLKKPELNSIDADGWLDTGDLARMDADGYIRITGRSKDVIIRGGENIPVVEIEGVLCRHDKIRDIALVAMPDPRLGERACAFVVPHPGQTISFAEMADFLEKSGVANPYWPERLEVVETMPRTPSGKIQKFILREMAAKLRFP